MQGQVSEGREVKIIYCNFWEDLVCYWHITLEVAEGRDSLYPLNVEGRYCLFLLSVEGRDPKKMLAMKCSWQELMIVS